MTGVDATPLDQFVNTGKGSYAQFKAHVAANPGGIPPGSAKQGWISEKILECPRFAILPVVNSAVDPPNGTTYFPVIGFKAVYFGDETPERGFSWQGSNLKAVRGFVFDIDYLPPQVSAQIAGIVGPYTGGPKVVQLVHDQDDPIT